MMRDDDQYIITDMGREISRFDTPGEAINEARRRVGDEADLFFKPKRVPRRTPITAQEVPE